MVSVSYSTDKGSTWKPVGTADAAAGTLSWLIPDEGTAQGLVRVASLDVGVSDTSNAIFSIEEKVIDPIVVVSPNGGENWVEDQVHPIRWTAPAEVSQVELHYSTDGGQSWNLIAGSASTAGTNSYTWTIPQVSTTQALVRVRSTADNTQQDVSDALFTIRFSTSSVPVGAVAGRGALSILGTFPNPFASATELRWRQGMTGEATLRIFDNSGQVIGMYDAGRLEAGEHRLTVTAGELPSGTYHYELRVGNATAHGVMMVTR
jgi:hypothetical protein